MPKNANDPKVTLSIDGKTDTATVKTGVQATIKVTVETKGKTVDLEPVLEGTVDTPDFTWTKTTPKTNTIEYTTQLLLGGDSFIATLHFTDGTTVSSNEVKIGNNLAGKATTTVTTTAATAENADNPSSSYPEFCNHPVGKWVKSGLCDGKDRLEYSESKNGKTISYMTSSNQENSVLLIETNIQYNWISTLDECKTEICKPVKK